MKEDVALDEGENEEIESIVGKVKISRVNEKAFREDSETKDFGGKVAPVAAEVEKNPFKENGSHDFEEKSVAKNFVEKIFENVKSENNENTKRVGLTFDIDEHFKERIDFNIDENATDDVINNEENKIKL